MSKVQSKWITVSCYILIFIAVVLLYVPTREEMIAQTAWVNIIKSTFTLNVLLAFFVWGIMIDKLTRKLPRKISWAIWGIGIVALVLIFKFVGGLPTVFG